LILFEVADLAMAAAHIGSEESQWVGRLGGVGFGLTEDIARVEDLPDHHGHVALATAHPDVPVHHIFHLDGCSAAPSDGRVEGKGLVARRSAWQGEPPHAIDTSGVGAVRTGRGARRAKQALGAHDGAR
jgi:hypothetical protein